MFLKTNSGSLVEGEYRAESPQASSRNSPVGQEAGGGEDAGGNDDPQRQVLDGEVTTDEVAPAGDEDIRPDSRADAASVVAVPVVEAEPTKTDGRSSGLGETGDR